MARRVTWRRARRWPTSAPRSTRPRGRNGLRGDVELLALVKHDCPVCDQVLPVLAAAAAAGAPLRILSQSDAEQTAEQARRVGLTAVPELDSELELSERF